MPLGAYMIEYAGGRRIKAPIDYGVTIAAMDRRYAQPMTQSMYRHAGYIATYLADPFVQEKTDDGREITLYGYEWINPQKDKPIKAVWLIAEGTTDAAVTPVRRDGREGAIINRLTAIVDAQTLFNPLYPEQAETLTEGATEIVMPGLPGIQDRPRQVPHSLFVAAVLAQEFHQIPAFVQRCHVQRSLPALVLGIDIGLVVQQQ